MESIRPFVKEDIAQVAALRGHCFQSSAQPSVAALEAYFEEIFFNSPWRDERLPSLVYRGKSGEVAGFLGVIPRPMTMKGQPIRAAVITQFMTSPGGRGVASMRLLKEFLSGPQDLSMADLANQATRKLWEILGGASALLYSIYWTYLLRPAARTRASLRARGLAAPIVAAAGPVGDLVDAILARMPKSAFRQAPPATTEEDAAEKDLLECYERTAGSHALRPEYDERSLKWLLEMVARKERKNALRKAVVRRSDGSMAGWYVYLVNADNTGEVAQIGAAQNAMKDVLGHLIYHAWREGLTALSGRAQPAFLHEYLQRQGRFRCGEPWTIIHSRRPELLDVVYRGNAFLTRLEGEWWLSF